ncbi:MAG: hypothetical protein ABI054_04900 [Planctomycetota bacterium]
MLSWIFRNRQRLSAIYGMAQATALPGARMQQKDPPPITAGPLGRPGHLNRRGGLIEVRPMPKRVG